MCNYIVIRLYKYPSHVETFEKVTENGRLVITPSDGFNKRLAVRVKRDVNVNNKTK